MLDFTREFGRRITAIDFKFGGVVGGDDGRRGHFGSGGEGVGGFFGGSGGRGVFGAEAQVVGGGGGQTFELGADFLIFAAAW